MNAEAFVDTNVLLYAISSDPGEAAKANRAREILAREDFGVSAQVLQEFFVNATKKIAEPLSDQEALDFIEIIGQVPVVPVSPETGTEFGTLPARPSQRRSPDETESDLAPPREPGPRLAATALTKTPGVACASEGAIQHVEIHNDVWLDVVCGGRPRDICGSGLLVSWRSSGGPGSSPPGRLAPPNGGRCRRHALREAAVAGQGRPARGSVSRAFVRGGVSR